MNKKLVFCKQFGTFLKFCFVNFWSEVKNYVSIWTLTRHGLNVWIKTVQFELWSRETPSKALEQPPDLTLSQPLTACFVKNYSNMTTAQMFIRVEWAFKKNLKHHWELKTSDQRLNDHLKTDEMYIFTLSVIIWSEEEFLSWTKQTAASYN